MRAVLRLAAKDLRIELRTRELAASGLLAGLLALAVGALALGEVAERAAVASGILWLALLFAASLLLARSFTAEFDRGTIDTLLTLPVDRATIWAGKALANLVLLVLLAAILLPALVVLLGAPLAPALAAAAPVVFLGLAGIAASGTLLAYLAAQTRARELLLPVLLLPVALPILLAALPATTALLAGGALGDAARELTLLAGYDLALSAVSWILFDFAAEA